MDIADDHKVSLPGAGETERTVLEEQQTAELRNIIEPKVFDIVDNIVRSEKDTEISKIPIIDSNLSEQVEQLKDNEISKLEIEEQNTLNIIKELNDFQLVCEEPTIEIENKEVPEGQHRFLSLTNPLQIDFVEEKESNEDIHLFPGQTETQDKVENINNRTDLELLKSNLSENQNPQGVQLEYSDNIEVEETQLSFNDFTKLVKQEIEKLLIEATQQIEEKIREEQFLNNDNQQFEFYLKQIDEQKNAENHFNLETNCVNSNSNFKEENNTEYQNTHKKVTENDTYSSHGNLSKCITNKEVEENNDVNQFRPPKPPRPPLPSILRVRENQTDHALESTNCTDLLKAQPSVTTNEDKLKEDKHSKLQDSRPPIPILTYQWEDVRRSKQKGGYPWTHLYKGPLGPDDEPEIILRYRTTPKIRRKTQEKLIEGSPIPDKKIIVIHDNILSESVPSYSSEKQSDQENNLRIEDKQGFGALKSILKRPHPNKLELKDDNYSSNSGEESPQKTKCCHPLVHKLKTMADRQIEKVTHKKSNVKRIPLKGDQKINLEEEQQILKLRESPKAGRRDRTSYIEKRDSDDIVEILELAESPSEARKIRESEINKEIINTTVVPDEIIELPVKETEVQNITEEDELTCEPTVSELLEEEMKNDPPLKAPRKKKEHVYEDIEDYFNESQNNLDNIVDDDKIQPNKMETAISDSSIIENIFGNESIKVSLKIQDEKILNEINDGEAAHLEYMTDHISERIDENKSNTGLLAPISSIDSTSSDEADRRVQLSTLSEESEQASNEISTDVVTVIKERDEITDVTNTDDTELPRSPAMEKKVTFSPSTEDDPDLRKEDIVVNKENIQIDSRWSNMSDHEYEPVGEPIVTSVNDINQSSEIPISDEEMEGAVGPISNDQQKRRYSDTSSTNSHERKMLRVPTEDEDDDNISAAELQQQIEDRYFNPTPESRTDCEIHTSQVDSSAIEDLPLKRENRKKGMINSIQNKRKNMEEKIRSHAGQVKNKLRGMKKPVTDSPKAKAKERKKFKTPDFYKNIQMPKFSKPNIKRPEFTKIKMKKPDFKFPDFKKGSKNTDSGLDREEAQGEKVIKVTKPQEHMELREITLNDERERGQERIQAKEQKQKDEKTKSERDKPRFSIPDLPKFKMPDRFSSLRLHRSKSLKESTISSETTSEDPVDVKQKPTKKRFDFGTYPRIFGKKKKKPIRNDSQDEEIDEIIHPVQFSTIQRSALKKQPQVSEWNKEDAESGKYQQFDDDINRTYRESSLEKRMRLNEEMSRQIDAEEIEPRVFLSEDQKQMTDYDEENREIHVLSSARQDEFKQRKPIERQESDLNSEDMKILEWVKQETIKNKLLGRDDSDPQSDEIDYKYGENLNDFETYDKELRGSTPQTNQETVSSGSSGLQRDKGILEEIDDDEFFLRKRGISDENLPTEYISSALREGLREPEMNSLAQVGQYDSYYLQNLESPNEQFNRNMNFDDVSQEHDFDDNDHNQDDIDYTTRYINDSYKTFPPAKPLRRTKKQYSEESHDQDDQNVPVMSHEQYYPETESETIFYANEHMQGIEQPDIVLTNEDMEDVDEIEEQIIPFSHNVNVFATPPTAPRRRKKIHHSPEKQELHRSRFSPTYYPPEDEIKDDVIVHRTEHEYLAEAFEEPPIPARRTRSRSQLSKATDDDRTSHGAESLTSDNQFQIDEPKCVIDYRDCSGYATVRKDPPPRPPAPLRRKRSTQSLVERQFFTMPMTKRDATPPARPSRNYITIAPSKPPRNKSASSLTEPQRQESLSTPDITQYEELDDDLENTESFNRDLQSGEVINKMKCRPLPPPPRPPRGPKKTKKSDKKDENGGAERLHSNADFLIEEDLENADQDRAIRDEFVDEDVGEARVPPLEPETLQEILKKEQEAELERARQLADAKNLEKGIQRFRESSQRNYSERSRASTGDRPKTPLSRPHTPGALVIERRTSTPTSYDHVDQTLTHVKLTVLPVDFDDDIDNIEELEREEQLLHDINVNNVLREDEVKEINQDNINTIEEKETNKFSKFNKSNDNHTLDSTNFEVEEEEMIQDEIRENEVECEHKEDVIEYEQERQDEDYEGQPEQYHQEEHLRDHVEAHEQEYENENEIEHEKENEHNHELEHENLKKDEHELSQEYEDEDMDPDIHLIPPIAPPRRKSLVTQTPALPPRASEQIPPITPPRVSSGDTSREPVRVESPLHDPIPNPRLQIAELEVDRLSVNALHANQIIVSDFQGVSINAQELDCRSGNLNVRSIDLPPGFIEEIVERIRSNERELIQQTEEKKKSTESEKKKNSTPQSNIPPHEEPPARPPPPQQPYFQEYFPFSMPPPSFYQLRNPSEEEPASHGQTQRRRRHQRKKDSTSEEEYVREQRRSRHETRSPEQSVSELTSQLARACSNAVSRTGNQIMSYIREHSKDENRRDLHFAIVIIIVIVAGLILFGMGNGNKTVHHHHWDYFNPPGGEKTE